MRSAPESLLTLYRKRFSGIREILTIICESIENVASITSSIGGEDHKTGQKRKTQKAYARLLARLKKIIPTGAC